MIGALKKKETRGYRVKGVSILQNVVKKYLTDGLIFEKNPE